jgi:tetratricopeptide (TPR) repeat protein
MLGVRSFAELKQEADELFAAGEYGRAKLAYERARDRGREAGPAEVESIARRVDECCDAIARERIRQAIEYAERGETELCMSEIANAMDTARSESVVREAEAAAEEAERRQAREQAVEPEPQTDEDKFAIIAGTWEEEQDEEYEGYGEPFRAAILELHDGRIESARQRLEALLKEAADPHYLHYEVGRARLLSEDVEGGVEALHSFLASIGPDEGGEARLSAHVELARAARDGGDFNGAVERLQEALTAMPADPRPYILMGNFLRREGMAEEASEVLESGIEMMGEAHPEWRLVQELGLAQMDLGNDARAVEMLEHVIEVLVARQHLDLPPETAEPLARLHEKAGQPQRAADLYTMLAQGSDRQNRFRYYGEAGRLLKEIGMNGEALRMLQRARELSPDEDEEARADLERRIAELQGEG